MPDLDPTAAAARTLATYRHRALQGVTWTFVVLLLLLCMVNVVTGLWGLIVVDLVLIGIWLGMLASSRRLGLEASTYILLGTAGLAATANALQTSGLWHGTVNYIALLPVLAGLLAGRRASVVLGIAGLGLYGLLASAHAVLELPVPVTAPEGETLLGFTLRSRLPDQIALHLCAAGVTYGFLTAIPEVYQPGIGNSLDRSLTFLSERSGPSWVIAKHDPRRHQAQRPPARPPAARS